MRSRSWGKAMLVTAIVGAMLMQGSGALAYQTLTDPDEASITGGDIKTVYWWDDATTVYLGFKTHEATVPDSEAAATWTFDLNNGALPPTDGPDGTPGELCIKTKNVGGTFQGELYKDCGGDFGGTVPASHPTTDSVEIAVPKTTLVANGLRGYDNPATTGVDDPGPVTKYNFRLSNTKTAPGSPIDQAPDQTTGVLTHTYGESPPPPPPPPGAQQTFDEQGVGAGNPGAGVLTINAVQDNIALGSTPPGSTKTAPVGDVDYTNTLASGNAWTVTVEATSLASGANKIHFSNLAFAGGGTISQVPAGAGATPTPNTSEQAFGSGTDPDPTPGQSYSTPVTIANAPASTQGSFKQSGSTLELTVPAAQPAGTYSGKLRYTITG